jgi:ATP-dependent Clp endopeptidase proteolytic subunit ClpP
MEVNNPYQNEHSCRKIDPKKFKSFTRTNNKFGTGIHAVWGKNPGRAVQLQAIRFDKDKFTVAQAKKWLKDHKHTCILFEKATGMTNYYLINEFENKAEILINGYIGRWDDNNAKDFVKEFQRLEKSYKNIDIRILNSGGGSVFEGNAMISTIRQSEATVNVYVDGLAASMAANIAISGDRLEMARVAKIMFHKATGGVIGNSDDLRSAADLLEDIENTMIEMLSEKTGESKEYFKDEFFSGKDKFLNAKEAEDLGISDDTYDKKEDNSDMLQTKMFDIAANTNNTNLNDNDMETIKNLKMFNAFLGINENASEIDMFREVQKIAASNEDLTKEAAEKDKKIEQLEKNNGILKDEIKGYKEQAETSRKEKIELLLTGAVEAGKITEDAKEEYRNLAELDERGFEYVKKALEKLNPYESVSKGIKQGNEKKFAERKDWTWEDYSKKDPDALAEMKEKDFDRYSELFEAKYGNKPTK